MWRGRGERTRGLTVVPVDSLDVSTVVAVRKVGRVNQSTQRVSEKVLWFMQPVKSSAQHYDKANGKKITYGAVRIDCNVQGVIISV